MHVEPHVKLQTDSVSASDKQFTMRSRLLCISFPLKNSTETPIQEEKKQIEYNLFQ